MPRLELQVELQTGRRFFLEMTASPDANVEDIEGWVQELVSLRVERGLAVAGIVNDDYHGRSFVAVPCHGYVSLTVHRDAMERFKLRVARDREGAKTDD